MLLIFLTYVQSTNNLEWYDPEAVTTEGGTLVITFSQKGTHDLSYQGGEHVSLYVAHDMTSKFRFDHIMV